MTSGNDTAHHLTGELARLRDYISAAAREVDSGKMAALDALHRDVLNICARVEAAPPEIARTVKPALAEVITELDILERALEDYKTRRKSEKRK